MQPCTEGLFLGDTVIDQHFFSLSETKLYTIDFDSFMLEPLNI